VFTAQLHSNCRCADHVENTARRLLRASVSAGMCLANRCLETGCIILLFYCCVRLCCGHYIATVAVSESLLSNGSMCHSIIHIINKNYLSNDTEYRPPYSNYCIHSMILGCGLCIDIPIQITFTYGSGCHIETTTATTISL
jgi:hypothetical protein